MRIDGSLDPAKVKALDVAIELAKANDYSSSAEEIVSEAETIETYLKDGDAPS